MTPTIRTVIILLIGLVIAIFTGNMIGEGSYFQLMILFTLGAFLLFLQRPDLLAFFCVALYFSGLTAPGVPGKLNIFYLCAILLIAITSFSFLLKRMKKTDWGWSHTFMAVFAVVILTTILVRGAGFRVLGSNTWGGMYYIHLFIGMFLVIALPQAGMRPSWWPKALMCMGVLSILPLMADVMILYGVAVGIVWRFIQGSGQIGISMQAQLQAEHGVVRYFSAYVTGQVMLIGFLCNISLKRVLSFRGLWLLPFPMAFFVVTFFGGFRLGVLMFLLIFLFVAFFERAFTPMRIYMMTFAIVICWFTLLDSAPYLPPSAQRAVSWVPGINIPQYVRADAEGTLDWRLDLWREGLKLLPKYWLIGKGYSFSEKEIIAVAGANQSTDPLGWALVTSSYHNGPISLLIGLGVFGLLIGMALLVAISFRHHRFRKGRWNDPQLKQCHQVVCAWYVVYFVIFLTLYGDVHVSFPLLFFFFALLEGIKSADLDAAASGGNQQPGRQKVSA